MFNSELKVNYIQEYECNLFLTFLSLDQRESSNADSLDENNALLKPLQAEET